MFTTAKTPGTSWLLNLLTGMAVVCAVLVTGLRIRDEWRANKVDDGEAPVAVKEWQQYAREGQRIGPTTAIVTIVEFSDFQCPFCRAAASTIRSIRQTTAGRVALVYRHYPGHEHSFAAAVAAECAAEQGMFEGYHDALFREADSIGVKSWSRFAADAGVSDTTKFAVCMTSGRAASRVVRDTAAAHALRVRGTPTFLINQMKVVGFRGADKMEADVASALSAATAHR
jgi:protein-disulfide isomerase